MKSTVIHKFNGVAPRFGRHLKTGYAQSAYNIDLSSGKIAPILDSALIAADTNQHNSLFYHNGGWEHANDRHYLSWVIGDYDVLIYLKSGVPYKKIGITEALLGQIRLGAPAAADNGAGVLDDTVYYIITTTRSVAGYTDESGPSDAVEITVAARQIRITAPTISDTDVTHWNIYRMSDATGEYQFLATVAAATTTYDDNTPDTDLGASPTTWYTSDQGNTIIWDTPPVTFDGLITEPYAGMIFAWKGSTLYWCEPGYMDAWPSFYSMNFPANIKRVIPFAGTIAVLTAAGPQRVDGTHPELIQPSKALGIEPCIGTAACVTSRGVVYLSDSGLVLFNLADTTVITDEFFTENHFGFWFGSSGILASSDNMIYLFGPNHTLVADMQTSKIRYQTLDIVATAVHVRPDTDTVSYIDATGIYTRNEGPAALTWIWLSGDIIGAYPDPKPWIDVEVIGSGNISLALYADAANVFTDSPVASKVLTFTTYRGRTLKFPDKTIARAIWVYLTGTGNVTEIIIRHD